MFPDQVSLCTSRGLLYRLLGNSEYAKYDFDKAHYCHRARKGELLVAVRIDLLRAMCYIDGRKYERAHEVLVKALRYVTTGNGMFTPAKYPDMSTGESLRGSINPGAGMSFSPLLMPNSVLSHEHIIAGYNSPHNKQPPPGFGAGGAGAGGGMPAERMDEEELRLLQRECQYATGAAIPAEARRKLEYTLQYHTSLTLYMLGNYEQASEVCLYMYN